MERQAAMYRAKTVFVAGSIVLSLALAGKAVEIQADNAKAIRDAFQKSRAGDTITIASGVYDMGNSLATGANGTQAKPIVVRATGAKGYAHLRANGTVPFRIKSFFWTFQGIHFEGSMKSTSAALFMDGPAGSGDIVIADCKISGSRDHGMKGAKLREKPVNRVLIARSRSWGPCCRARASTMWQDPR